MVGLGHLVAVPVIDELARLREQLTDLQKATRQVLTSLENEDTLHQEDGRHVTHEWNIRLWRGILSAALDRISEGS